MRVRRYRALFGVACLIIPAAAAAAGETGAIDLTYRGFRNWDFELPAEQFSVVSKGINGCGVCFKAVLVGRALSVDVDGDGKLDRRVTGKTDDFGVSRARVTLKSKDAAGGDVVTAVRLKDEGKGWTYAAGGAMAGQIGSTRILLFDQNNNGRYDDFGQDAMIVGRGKYATFLSRVIRVDGNLLSIDVTPDGKSLTHKPFTGETGSLDMTSALETNARLLSVVLVSSDKSTSFDAALASGGMVLPAGDYTIHSGKLGLGKQTVRIRAGRAKPITVPANGKAEFKWGGPLSPDARYARQGGRVVFSPDNISLRGAAGEEYYDWSPRGKSPEFTLTDSKSGQVLKVVVLPGSS